MHATRRRTGRPFAFVVVALAISVFASNTARAESDSDADRVAVVTPLLEAARVGNQLGPALLCPTALGVVQQALALGPPEVAQLASTAIDQANQFCHDFSDANAPAIETMIDQAASLSPANPALDAAIDALADLLTTTGGSSGGLVGGRTLVQLADVVGWLHS